jgi:hypothetical protein
MDQIRPEVSFMMGNGQSFRIPKQEGCSWEVQTTLQSVKRKEEGM